MSAIKYLFPILIGAVAIGCEKEILNSGESSINRPVVEAYLHPGQPASIFVSRQIPLNADSTEARGIEGLSISIAGPDGTFFLIDKGGGVYTADSSWTVQSGQTYTLAFQLSGASISAVTVVPSSPTGLTASATTLDVPTFSIGGGTLPTFPDPIALSWENLDGYYYLVVVENVETNPTVIFEQDSNNTRPRPVFRGEPEQTDRYDLDFRNFTYYGLHRVILYKLNAEYASLYDDNGNSSQNLTTPFTNISGGLGIFTGINSDTVYVTVN